MQLRNGWSRVIALDLCRYSTTQIKFRDCKNSGTLMKIFINGKPGWREKPVRSWWSFGEVCLLHGASCFVQILTKIFGCSEYDLEFRLVATSFQFIKLYQMWNILLNVPCHYLTADEPHYQRLEQLLRHDFH